MKTGEWFCPKCGLDVALHAHWLADVTVYEGPAQVKKDLMECLRCGQRWEPRTRDSLVPEE